MMVDRECVDEDRHWGLAQELLNNDKITEKEREFVARFLSWSYLDMPITEDERARIDSIYTRVIQ